MKRPKFFLSISLQISVFLLLVAFVPVAIMMALKTYEKQLLELTERSNVQQGRIVAASLSENPLAKENAQNLLSKMNGQFDARIRIIGKDRKLLADSATTQKAAAKGVSKTAGISSRYEDSITSSPSSENKKSSEKSSLKPAEDTFVYRLFSIPVRIYRKFFRPPSQNPFAQDYYTSKSLYDGKEIGAALEGFYGSTTRFSQGSPASVTLYSALPVFDEKNEVSGVVLVSRSTYRILQNLYELRRDLGKVFLASLIFVALTALFFTFRISHPLKKLSKEAFSRSDRQGRVLSTEFTGKKRIDEIGLLSRSLTTLLEKLNARITFTERFAGDVSHEFKNPLAAIRSCSEALETPGLSHEEQKEFITAITEEVTHLQNLLTGVRNITKIDAGITENEKIENLPLNLLTKNIMSRLSRAFPDTEFDFEPDSEEINLRIPADYFDRMAENLISNAAGFGTKVKVRIMKTEDSKKNEKVIFSVEDNGKGVAEEEKEKIFERFYSYRPDAGKTNHTGLGLSTVKAIADALEAKITVGKSESLGGARFCVEF
ncbi:MAG: HAMP domain-containing histidine kinase [Treponema sp.]|nr:HAMP domain-containing histidine kinase [Treponema sp.]